MRLIHSVTNWKLLYSRKKEKTMSQSIFISEVRRCIANGGCPENWCYCERYDLMELRQSLSSIRPVSKVIDVVSRTDLNDLPKDPAAACSGGG